MEKLRLAIIGAGPAGIYAADILLKTERSFDVSIDLFDRLPAPYGLVRYGVAPDHPRIKGIITALRDVLDTGRIRIFGNVDFGTDLTLDDIRRHYHAVIFATGAIRDAELRIPGIDAEGSYGAADFVNWYDGHPDVPREWPLDAAVVGVVGNGNVALDVARVLAKHADDMLPTEIPDNVYAGLANKAVTDVHVFGRRGPANVKFTPLELRELGEVPGVDVVVYDEDFERDPAALKLAETNKQLMVIRRILTKWRDAAKQGEHTAPRRIHLHWYARPVEVVRDDEGRVAALRVERTEPDGAGGVRGMGEYRDYPMQQLYRAVGYFGSPMPGVPFDESRGVIPNREGQVIDERNQQVYGMYTTGWIKRGPVGLIGHTKSDAMETIRHLVQDQRNWWSPSETDEASVVRLLEERGVRWTDLDGWHRLDEHELALGAERDRTRVKVVDRDEMVRISRQD